MQANKIALDGRWHGSADECEMTSNVNGTDPWHRVDLRWKDGGHVYCLFDTRDEAVSYANTLGFFEKA
jgi:hypothetical protein